MSCKVIFASSHCDFQDQNASKIIGRVESRYRLYYLDALEGFLYVVTIDPTHKISLHHKKLEHSSFFILNVMFLSLFKKLKYENLHYDICEFIKHKRVIFFISNKRI